MNGKTGTGCERDQLVTGVLSTSGDAGVRACALPPSHGPGEGVGMQHANSAVSTDLPDHSKQSDASSSSVVVDALKIHNSVINAEKLVVSFCRTVGPSYVS